MSRARVLLTSALLLAGAVARAHAEDVQRLRFDPFAMPAPESLARAPAEALQLDSPNIFTPELRATLVGDDAEASFANLGGIVLAVGESAEGYRLLEVREWEADFERGEEVLTLMLKRRANP